jgi:outer membrane protein TolC
MRILRAAICLIGFSLVAVAQPPARVERQLSLDDCIVIATQHDLRLQIAKYNPIMARYTLSGAYGAYDPTFSFSGEHDYRLSPGGVDEQGRPFRGTESESDSFTTAIGGLLPWGLSYRLQGDASDQVDSRQNTSITNLVSFERTEVSQARAGAIVLQQPLLRNFWIDQPRLQIFLDKTELMRWDLDLKFQFIDEVTKLEHAYYELLYNEENVRVQEMAVELAEKLLAENKKKVEVGSMAPLDEKKAEADAAARRADLLGARAARDTAERLLKSFLSDDYTNTWANVSIKPTDRLVAVPQMYDLQESWRKGLSQDPQVLIGRLTVEQQKQRIRLSHNQLFPQVDAFGSYGYAGSAKEFSGAFGQIADRDNPFYTFGAQISIPLSRTAERNQYKEDKARRTQLELTLKQAEQSQLILIENDIGRAMSSYESVQATREARLYAEAALEAEEKKLENGKSTSFFVLDAQSKLTAARSAEIRALADYNNALSDLASHEGSTLERRRIDLEDAKEP